MGVRLYSAGMRRIPNIAFALLVSALLVVLGCGDSSSGGGSAGDDPSETPDEASSSQNELTCNGSKSIPELVGPLSLTVAFPGGFIATDVDVDLVIGHNRLHDLTASLTHVNSATTVVLFDRITLGATPCTSRNLAATVSNRTESREEIQDEACNPSTDPTVDGIYRALGNMQNFDGLDPGGDWILTIEDERIQHAGTLEEFCIVASNGTSDTRVCSTDVPAEIPDPPGFTLQNDDSFLVTDIVAVLGIDHGDVSELRAVLSHDGRERVLFDGLPSDSPPNPCNGMDVTLDDTAGTSILAGCMSANVPAVDGTFLPEESLAQNAAVDFLDQQAQGEWDLSLVDADAGIVGELTDFCLIFNGGGRSLCSGSGPFPIPVTDLSRATADITTSRTITRVDIDLEILHPRLNDMVATLTHDGLTTTLFTRIQLPQVFGGGPCEGADIDGKLSDFPGFFGNGRIQDEKCSPVATPAIQFQSFPAEPLAAFNGQDAIGTWTLEIDDVVSGNSGQILEFCVTINPGTLGVLVVCSTDVGGLIPDREASIQLEVLERGVVADVDTEVRIEHDWLGDLGASVAHAARGVELFSGITSATGGACFGDNMDVVFDDAAGPGVASEACFNFRDPAVSRRYRTSDPGFGLALFNGQDSDGSWVMKIADSDLDIDGQVDEFCVAVDAE